MSKFCSGTRMFAHNVNRFISDFPDLKYDGREIICLICNVRLLAFKKSLCIRHVNSVSHKLKKSGQTPYTEFILDLIFMLCAWNVPVFILDKDPFRKFWTKYNPTCKLPSRRTVQRHLPSVRERLENNITSQIHNKKLWLAVDDTTDSKKHSVVNVIVRTLDPLQPSSAYLLASKRLEECTSETIRHLIIMTLHKFHLSTQQVLLFVTDSAATMLATGPSLKKMCPNLIHITCLLHALHLTAEMIRKCYPDVDALIAHTKAVFFKSPKRTLEFQKQCPGVPELPQPILTRSGTWLEATFHYLQNFQKIKSLVLQFDVKEAAAIRESQIKFQDAQVEADLQTIHSNYAQLADSINKLQNTSLSLGDSLQIVEDVQKVLQPLNDENGIRVREKFDSVIMNNPDFTRLKHVYKNSTDTDPLNNFRDHFNYANITSLDADRSFSLYKKIYSSQRTSLAEETLETYAMLQMFSQAHPDF